jgi:hypothetical protein
MNKALIRLSPYIVALALLLLGLGMLKAARAHGWYDHLCCSNQDCAPVERAEMLTPAQASLSPTASPQTGYLWVETKYGRGIVPATLVPRESKDHLMHACITPQGKVICLYLPPSH